ncbi:antibiotic biosynthesis monooxygenase family protein [uncultured Pontibacter sp.]|uniref:antibiotic biosynthesis monooxygenase family protein n=1 Tax=uncultured Pontibacter sp. TaxID=453356 RepID=UPI00262BD505|nr:antibiotic biosynthesis monooxygenase family protein [uncultured Pontibacter sp.]
MFIAVSTFTIANDMAPEVRDAFINRPHLVDNAPGFVKMDVMSAKDNPNEIWLMTYWTDEEHYTVWYKNHMRASHQDIPKGLKLVPHSSKVLYFNHISG